MVMVFVRPGAQAWRGAWAERREDTEMPDQSALLGTVFERSPDMVARTVEGEEILVPIVRSAEEVDSIYTLNEVGSFIWERLDGARSVTDILDAVGEEYEGDVDYMSRTVLEFVNDLVEIKAVVAKG